MRVKWREVVYNQAQNYDGFIEKVKKIGIPVFRGEIRQLA